MDSILHLIGIAKKAGRLEVGEEPVGAAARAHHARVILVAGDAADNTNRRAARFGEAGNTTVVTTPYTKAELGSAVGRASCALMAITDAGLAASVTAKLAAADSTAYGAAAEALGTKAAKVLKRQREQRQHEKNLQRGKQKPWAAPGGKVGAEARLAQKAGGTATPTQGPGKPRPKASAPGQGSSFPRSTAPGKPRPPASAHPKPFSHPKPASGARPAAGAKPSTPRNRTAPPKNTANPHNPK